MGKSQIYYIAVITGCALYIYVGLSRLTETRVKRVRREVFAYLAGRNGLPHA